MKMTFEQYIASPMGKGNAVISNKEMYRSMYIQKLDKIMKREKGKLAFFLYTKDDRYLIHLKIPSESTESLYYDVVIEYYTDDNAIKASRSLDGYYVRFYSNDPSFIYTFAHAFLKNDLVVPELEKKISAQARKNTAEVKNPGEIVGYVKSFYFAYLIIKNRGLDQKVQFESYGQKLSVSKLLKDVEHADKKIASGHQLRTAMAIKKKQEQAEKLNKQNNERNLPNSTNPDLKVKTTSKVKRINASSHTVPKAKHTKKI